MKTIYRAHTKDNKNGWSHTNTYDTYESIPATLKFYFDHIIATGSEYVIIGDTMCDIITVD